MCWMHDRQLSDITDTPSVQWNELENISVFMKTDNNLLFTFIKWASALISSFSSFSSFSSQPLVHVYKNSIWSGNGINLENN